MHLSMESSGIQLTSLSIKDYIKVPTQLSPSWFNKNIQKSYSQISNTNSNLEACLEFEYTCLGWVKHINHSILYDCV